MTDGRRPVAGQGGIAAALAAALLFGASTPAAKLLLDGIDPWMLAGLFYLGSGIGLGLWRLARTPRHDDGLAPGDGPWLAGAILTGGVAGPLLLLWGLAGSQAAGTSLLLNAEGVFTTLLAWLVFRENVTPRIAFGMAAIIAGALVLAWPAGGLPSFSGRPLAVLGACLCWAVDNNLTRRVSLSDPVRIAALKGMTAGATNLALALLTGSAWPGLATGVAAAIVGFFGYGISLVLFVLGLRTLGTARAGAYFSAAPFVGAILALPLLGERPTPSLAIAGGLMAVGLWLHLSEHHAHDHHHPAMAHSHRHSHGDDHHRHDHDGAGEGEGEDGPGAHSHWHRHSPTTHRHPHFPDAHHRHDHDGGAL